MYRQSFDSCLDGRRREIFDFWNGASCGEALYLRGDDYASHSKVRYQLEPCIPSFAGFSQTAARRVLEIGVGLGADHLRFAEAGAILTGIDLTPRAIWHTKRRLERGGHSSDLRVADAEHMPYEDNSFDVVYSWGVIHHSPDMKRAASEIIRVLRPGGRYAVMVYNRYSIVGLMLKLRYGFGKSLDHVYAAHLESPGTQAITPAEAQALFPACAIRTELSVGDLLEGDAGQRHSGLLLSIARLIWPRWFIRRFCRRFGLFLLIEGVA